MVEQHGRRGGQDPEGPRPRHEAAAAPGLRAGSLREDFASLEESDAAAIRAVLAADPRFDARGELPVFVTGPNGTRQLNEAAIESHFRQNAEPRLGTERARTGFRRLLRYYHAYLRPFPDPTETESLRPIFDYLQCTRDDRGAPQHWDVTYLEDPVRQVFAAAASWRILPRTGARTYVWNEHTWTDPEFRGSGLGTRILRELEARCLALGADCLFIEVDQPYLLSTDPRGFRFGGAEAEGERRAFWTREAGQSMDPFDRLAFWRRQGFRLLAERHAGAHAPVRYAQVSLDREGLQLPLEIVLILVKPLRDTVRESIDRAGGRLELEEWLGVYREGQLTIDPDAEEHPPYRRTVAALREGPADLELLDPPFDEVLSMLARTPPSDPRVAALSDLQDAWQQLRDAPDGPGRARMCEHLAIAVRCHARATGVWDVEDWSIPGGRLGGVLCELALVLGVEAEALAEQLPAVYEFAGAADALRRRAASPPESCAIAIPAATRSAAGGSAPLPYAAGSLREWWVADAAAAECFLGRYLGAMRACFPDEDECPEPEVFFRVLRGDPEYDFLVYLHGDEIVGGAHGWLRDVGDLRLWMGTFVWTLQGERGRGLGALIVRTAEQWARSRGAHATIGEVNDSSLMSPAALEEDAKSGVTTEQRERWWNRLGYAKLAMQYVQPALSDELEPVAHLALCYKPLRGDVPKGVSRATVLELVRHYHFKILEAQGSLRSLEEVAARSEFRTIATALAAGPDPVPLVPLTRPQPR